MIALGGAIIMADNDARLMVILEELKTYCERGEAIQRAMRLGMPLHELEDYLDWLDQIRPNPIASMLSTRRGPNGG
jgi:hypothetical protein